MIAKTSQGKQWSMAPQYWALHFEPWFLPMYKKVLEMLELTDKHILLDAGCGSGLFSYMAIAAGAQVIGVDASPGLLRIARQRNPLNIFLEEDMESLPFDDHSFHVVTGFNSFQYAGMFDNTLAEAVRVLKPGGRLVLGIWDKPEMNDATHVLAAIEKLLTTQQPKAPEPFALSEDGKIEEALKSKGLRLIHKSVVHCPFLYAGLQDGIKSFMGTGPATAAIVHHSRTKVKKTIAMALEPFRLPDGFHFLQNQSLVFIAEK